MAVERGGQSGLVDGAGRGRERVAGNREWGWRAGGRGGDEGRDGGGVGMRAGGKWRWE